MVEFNRVKEKLPPAVFSLVFLMTVIFGLYSVWRYWGLIDAVVLVIGLVIGIGIMPAMATPFFPSPPKKGGLLQQFVKIYMTVSSMILGSSVFYLKGSGEYVRKRLHIDGDTATFVVDDTKETWKGAKQRLVTFGRRPLGLAWSEEHPLYQEIAINKDIETDGGDPATLVNMDQLHRILRGMNQLRAIDSAVRDAKDEYGGGDRGPGTYTIVAIAGFMLILGAATMWFAMG